MDDVKFYADLYNVFDKNGWHDKEEHGSVFERFCVLISHLDMEQKKLLLELSGRYIWISYAEYAHKLIHIFENVIGKEMLISLKKIIVFPIMKPEDEDKVKSGHSLLYQIRSLKPALSSYKKIEFVEISSYNLLKDENFKLKNDECIFLVDDYLGSGETLKSTLFEIEKNKSIPKDKVNIVAIAAQEDSVRILEENNISYFIDTICKKGISDYYSGDDLNYKIDAMKSIEKLIPANNFKFGYNASEALITMLRTPDNTFPIFWKEHKINNIKYEAPFPR